MSKVHDGFFDHDIIRNFEDPAVCPKTAQNGLGNVNRKRELSHTPRKSSVGFPVRKRSSSQAVMQNTATLG
jgi:hypothetical protein